MGHEIMGIRSRAFLTCPERTHVPQAGTRRCRTARLAVVSLAVGSMTVASFACGATAGASERAAHASLVARQTSVAGSTWGTADPVVVSSVASAPTSWTLTVSSPCQGAVRTISGTQPAAGAFQVAWDKATQAGAPAAPGLYTLALTVNGSASDAYTGVARILTAPGAPADPCGTPAQFTVVGAGFGHGVGLSQWGAYAMAKAGYDAPSIVSHYYVGTTVAPVTDSMDVLINILYRVKAAKLRSEPAEPGGGSIEVTVGSTVVLGSPADAFTFTPAPGAIVVNKINGGVTTPVGTAPSVGIHWAGTRTPGTATGPATLANITSGTGSLTAAGHRYRYGSITITPAAGGSVLNVVNAVRLHDEYLYGISEVSSSWPAAALQAQVIAARSYALRKLAMGTRSACACTMDNGHGPYSDQTFSGWSKASGAMGANWLAAVNATDVSDTTGLAAVGADGQPIQAFYTASTGGITTAAKDAWGTNLPFAQSVDDHWSQDPADPDASWTVSVPQATMASAFGVPAVNLVMITDRLSSGAVKTLTATLPDGSTRSITGSHLQSVMHLKSRYFTSVDGLLGVPLPAVPLTPPPASAPSPTASPEVAPSVSTPVVPASPAPSTSPSATSAPSSGGDSVALPAKATLFVRQGLHPAAGIALRFHGKVNLARAGLQAQQQVLKDGTWVTRASVVTDRRGHYVFTVPKATPSGATYQYRVVVANSAGPIAISDPLTITIR